jgi:hypothetical protein
VSGPPRSEAARIVSVEQTGRIEQMSQRKKALAAGQRAKVMTRGAIDRPFNAELEPAMEQRQRIEL